MGKRQKEWGRRARLELIEKLGGKCARCPSTENLTFDCITPQGHAHHKLSSDQRVNFYRTQYVLDNVQVLCKTCHEEKTKADNKTARNKRHRDKRKANKLAVQSQPPNDNEPF